MIKLDTNHPAYEAMKEIEDWYFDGLLTKDEAIERLVKIIKQYS